MKKHCLEEAPFVELLLGAAQRLATEFLWEVALVELLLVVDRNLVPEELAPAEMMAGEDQEAAFQEALAAVQRKGQEAGQQTDELTEEQKKMTAAAAAD